MAGLDGKGDNFRNGVGMNFFDPGFQFFKPVCLCFDDEEGLAIRHNLSFPPIERMNPRNDIDTGRQPVFNEIPGDRFGPGSWRCGDVDNGKWRFQDQFPPLYFFPVSQRETTGQFWHFGFF